MPLLNQMAELFDRDVKTIGRYIDNGLRKQRQLSQNLRPLSRRAIVVLIKHKKRSPRHEVTSKRTISYRLLMPFPLGQFIPFLLGAQVDVTRPVSVFLLLS